MSLAKVTISGTIASEPEKRFTSNQNVAVTNFNLAVPMVGRNAGSDETFLVKVICWRQMAEVAAEQLHRGDNVLLEGRLLTSSYQTPEGVAKKGFEIEAANIDKLPGVPQPLLVGAAAGGATASGGGSSSRGGGGGSNYASAPMGGASAPVTAGGHSAQSGGSDFSSEDLLTEDDIPF